MRQIQRLKREGCGSAFLFLSLGNRKENDMDLTIPLQPDLKQPMYGQIYEFIKEEIRRGNLAEGTRLPSTRALADHLRVSRSTTQMAYEQLTAEGYIEPSPYRGYFVQKVEDIFTLRQDPHPVIWDEPAKPEADIDFSPRGIDLSHFPYATWRKLTKEVLGGDNKEIFLAGSPQGEAKLREAIRSYLRSARAVDCRRDQIVIGAGSEYLLMLLSLLLGRERTIAMENPTYRQAYRVLSSLGYAVEPVEMDRYGMNAELLEKSGADIAYVMPSHQYPLGIVMPVKRRQELLAWAVRKEGRYLIEDDYDSEFRYKGKPVPALQGMDGNGRVIYMGTFSKSIAPAIRVGYMVLPDPLLAAYRENLHFYASTVSRIDQEVLLRFLGQGSYERHLNRMRAIYKSKHDTLLGELRKLGPRFRISGEYAGLHVLIKDLRGRPEGWLVEQAKRSGVAVYPLSDCLISGMRQPAGTDPGRPSGDGRYQSTVMLGYANVSASDIVRGAERLRCAWCEEGEEQLI